MGAGRSELSGTSGRSFPSVKGTEKTRDHEGRSRSTGRVWMTKPHLCLVSHVVTLPKSSGLGRSTFPPPLPFPGITGHPSTAQWLCRFALLLTALGTPSPPPGSTRSCSPSSRLLVKAVALPLLLVQHGKQARGRKHNPVLDGQQSQAHTDKASQLLEMQGRCWRPSQLLPSHTQTTLLSCICTL